MSLTIREEKILEAAVEGTDVPLEPVTRREMIFAKAAGADVALPPAQNKEEQILSQLAASYAEGGGGGDFEVFNVHEDPEASTETRGYLDATWQEVYDAIIANKFVAVVAAESPDRTMDISISHENGESGGIRYAQANIIMPSKTLYISYASGSDSQWLATLNLDEEGYDTVQLRADSANSKLWQALE